MKNQLTTFSHFVLAKLALAVCATILFFGFEPQLKAQDAEPDLNMLLTVLGFELPQWDTIPKLETLSPEEAKLSAVVITDRRLHQYQASPDDPQSAGYLHLLTEHKIIRINDDKAVEQFNKVYIPLANDAEIVNVQARAISADGNKIINLDKTAIKNLDNVKGYSNIKLFAIEGVEIGGQVEYLYSILKIDDDVFGREVFQSDVAVRDAYFEIISPKSLEFEAVGYNGFPKSMLKTSGDKNILSCSVHNLPALYEETYSNLRANLARIDYKLAYDRNHSLPNRMYSWEEAATFYSQIFYQQLSKKEIRKEISKTLKPLKLKKLSVAQKISAIENYLKDNFVVTDAAGPEFARIENMLDKKTTSEIGMTVLMVALLSEANITHNIVLTSNRTEYRFDKNFDNWGNFTEILLFFPETKQFIIPSLVHFRAGIAPYHLAGQFGLYIDPKTHKGQVMEIPMPKAAATNNTIDAKINFDANMNPKANIIHSFTGYRAMEYRVIYQMQPEKEELMKEILTSGMKSQNLRNTQVKNYQFADNAKPDLPFTVSGEFDATDLIEKAGNNFLFKIGNIIGPQTELYQEHERQNPIDMQYPVDYKRIITIEIPQGYVVKGLDDLKIDIYQDEKGRKINRFISDYKLEGNKLTVTANEFYDKISMPAKDYEAFRAVINAAADFNKLVLVFEKK